MSGRRRQALGWLLTAALAVLLAFANPLADRAAGYNRDVTIGSTALYGTLRVMNSVMSVAKDADVTGGVGVASVTASPGQLLQPVTNTIDRMAELLFWLAILSGILSTIVLPVAKVAAVGLAAASALLALIAGLGRSLPEAGQRLMRGLVVLGLVGALALPLSYTLAFHAGEAMTNTAWKQATAVFDRLQTDYSDKAAEAAVVPPPTPAPEVAPPEQSLLGRIGTAIGASGAALSETVTSASGVVERLSEGVISQAKVVADGVAISGDLFNASIAIAVSYLVRILVLPALILGACLYLIRLGFR
ncbi:hypothetical protein BTR14_00545 [Rhizobium rhizosphaerae]|uniref:TrbL/VirB6 plasmid conjugal transfer protein n=1 Tax=Xaviernesmea rhizosphaerae TaxID=1672749 RepID=A0ABX3PIT8_9HYPH|nr:hypothetical protein [Xaviernesmea rhizosphaerae]OQP88011.1 hypothetical protein BTR14_00545 [Xaviernesmea rhizosphaerae]